MLLLNHTCVFLLDFKLNKNYLRFLILQKEVSIKETPSLTSVAIGSLVDYLREAGCTGVTKYDLKGEVHYQGVKLTMK